MDLFIKDHLLHNLGFMHQVIVASERLLKEAIAELPFVSDLRTYYIKHLLEETNHAKWLSEDLGGFKLPIQQLAVEMAGSAYYMIKHVHPACLLGYMKALENPIPLDLIEELELVHGKKLLRTARLHAEEDIQHDKDLAAQIDKLTPEVCGAVAEAFRITSAQIARYNELNKLEMSYG
jgi:hypothetical protein